MTYRLFYAPGTASFAVHWMLVELGVTFEAERVDLKSGQQKTPAYLKLNPEGRVPTLAVGDEAHAESAALLIWLTERHPEAGLAPAPGAPGRGKWLETMVFLATPLGGAMRDWFYADTDGDPADADAVRRLAQKRIEGAWDRLDALLSDGRPHLLGETITTADFLAVMYMRWARNMRRPATTWPHLGPYVTHLRARPGFAEVCRREGLTEWVNG